MLLHPVGILSIFRRLIFQTKTEYIRYLVFGQIVLHICDNTCVRNKLQDPELRCHIPDSTQTAPLLPVMAEYSTHVTPHCPPACSCHFYHFVPRHSQPPAFSFTVSVNCSGSGLSKFPVLPRHTVRLDMSHNNIQSEVTSLMSIS